MPSNISIIDFGSARLKLQIGHVSEDGSVVSVASTKSETGFLGKIQADGQVSSEDVNVLLQALAGFVTTARTHDSKRLVLVATESLRKTANHQAIMDRIQSELNLQVNVLSPALEADTFFTGVSASLGEALPVADIGGGSVQLAWDIGGSISIPTGTFALEKKFQSENALPDHGTYEKMRAFVQQELTEALRGKVFAAKTLVIGSSAMRDFFDSALTASGIIHEAKETYPASEVDALFQAIAGKPYESLGDLFPKNPKFLYGGDKLLINVQELLRITGATSIRPTNESLSTSLIRLASKTEALSKIGIEASLLS